MPRATKARAAAPASGPALTEAFVVAETTGVIHITMATVTANMQARIFDATDRTMAVGDAVHLTQLHLRKVQLLLNRYRIENVRRHSVCPPCPVIVELVCTMPGVLMRDDRDVVTARADQGRLICINLNSRRWQKAHYSGNHAIVSHPLREHLPDSVSTTKSGFLRQPDTARSGVTDTACDGDILMAQRHPIVPNTARSTEKA